MKNGLILILTILFLTIFFNIFIQAEVYMWVDENGIPHYCDTHGPPVINSPINSTGSLRNSLRLEKKLKDTVNEKGFKATQSYRIVGNAYGELLDEGATPQQAKATVSKLERWISNKPVTLDKIKNKNKVAGLIKRKIDRDGIQGTGFLQKIVDKQFNNVLGVLPSLVKDIELNLEDMFVTLGWDKKGQNTFVRKT